VICFYHLNDLPSHYKNAPSKFENIMNEILEPISHFSIIYIDDVLIFSKSIEEHWKHLNAFLEIIKVNGLVVSITNIKLFQNKVRILGYNIYQWMINPIDIQFVDKFLDVILDKTQLQRFLGSLNYVVEFYQNLRKQCKPLFDRLKDSPPPWTQVHTSTIQEIKKYVKTLPYLAFLPKVLSKLLKLMPPMSDMVTFSSKESVGK
jgi:hypothetical protein